MKKQLPIKQVTFYLWVALAYLLIWNLGNLINDPATFWVRAINEIWRTVFVTAVNYVLFEYTLPYINLSWKRILIGLVLIWAHLMVYSFGLYAWRHLGIQLHIYTPWQTAGSTESRVSFQMSYSVLSVVFFGVIRHIYYYLQLKQAAQQLRIEKQAAELNYLKSQTNPHFLFNTLNNIYSLSRDKSDLAPESILRLSKILRYMLYETNDNYVAIEQELKVINDYIALEKLRYDDSLHINFRHDIEDLKQALPPLLLIPLVENAFKHGVSETRDQPFIDIHLSVNKRQLLFAVKNSTDEAPGDHQVKENIGLSNLRRQLELLFKEYDLTTQYRERVFIATLKINLASHV